MSFYVEYGPAAGRKREDAKLDDVIPLAEAMIQRGELNVEIRHPDGDGPVSIEQFRLNLKGRFR
jgi:hypothetical protein